MDARHKRVLEVIQQCRGRERAMTARQLGRLVGIGEREVRAIVAELRRQGHPIASAVHPPYGFFVPASAEEARECQAHLYSRMREIGVTARALEQAYGKHLPGRQLVLSLFDDRGRAHEVRSLTGREAQAEQATGRGERHAQV